MAKQNTQQDPVGRAKRTRVGKRPQEQPDAPPTSEDADETEEETQVRDSERAFDHALGRMPPG